VRTDAQAPGGGEVPPQFGWGWARFQDCLHQHAALLCLGPSLSQISTLRPCARDLPIKPTDRKGGPCQEKPLPHPCPILSWACDFSATLPDRQSPPPPRGHHPLTPANEPTYRAQSCTSWRRSCAAPWPLPLAHSSRAGLCRPLRKGCRQQ